MRFLILTQYFPPEIGAPQIRLAALVRGLKRRGYEVEIVTALPHHLVGEIFAPFRRRFYVEDDFEGCTVHRTWAYAATGTGVARLLNYLSFTLTSLVGLARTRRPDYILVESPPLFLGISGIIFSTLRRVPMIFNVADLWPDSVRELGVLKNRFLLSLAERLESWIYSRSRFVNAITPGIQKDLISKKKLPASKVLLLPNGADTSLFFPRTADGELLKKLHLEGMKIFIYAGTHGVAQGLHTIIDAAELLKSKNIVFLFIGEGPTKKALVRSVADKRLGNVAFIGMQPVEVMPKFFSIATASIVPLVRIELFKAARPSKIFSSLAAGVPVIFCGEGETADMLTENRSGVVVAPENPSALAEAIARLSDDDELLNELSRNGRKLVQGHFSWDVIIGQWLDELLSARAEGPVRNQS